MRYIREFIQKHMKAEDVIIDQSINEKVWERGIEKIPSKIKVKAVKEDETVEVTLVEE
jgi:large subunit ribosomal protein L31e